MRVDTTYDAQAPNHDHRLRIVSDDDGELYIEVTEPRKCTCVVRRPMSEVVHMMMNSRDDEWFAISCRDEDAARHSHETHQVSCG